ncbi:snare domain-containing protein [Diplodia corticola]|uniref:t-SNARE affecting a late Golgi compartment protein 1 n=1 Tax=Diplodia corticola TaxID=236234 RepID=A0A1J9QX75_9PEZI|nr:snare domain-containing protein [Diplodia corticola]OJD33000.1 snare domain-containing protein [Diplodia corticola]
MMSATNDEDPFLQVQADVLSLLDTTRPLFQSYLRIRSSASSAANPELVDARQELEQALTDLSADLQDLVDSVRAVERDPYRFGLEIDEVERRRRLVEDVGKEVERMRAELVKTISTAAASASSSAAGKGKDASANPDVLPDPDGFEEDDDMLGDDAYAAMEQERQMELMQEQDQALDGVFRTVGNLRMQADEMGRELEEQGGILEEVDTVADRVGGKLQNGLKRVGWVIRQNEDKYSSCCIAVLIFVLIVILVLLVVL